MPIAGNISRVVRDSYEAIHAFSIHSNISFEAWNASFTQSLPNNKGKVTVSFFIILLGVLGPIESNKSRNSFVSRSIIIF
jgi:hypothetical protein